MGDDRKALDAIPWNGDARTSTRASRIALIYAAVATLWILFSDQALHLLVPDPDIRTRWSVYKGLTFVAVTSVMLLLLMRQAFGAIGAGYVSLVASEEQRRVHQLEAERMSRLYAALSRINQTIARSEDRDELFTKVCEGLVEDGGFCVAGISWHDPKRQLLEPVAWWGEEGEKLSGVSVSTGDGTEDRGPPGIAFREDNTHVCNDITGDAPESPWRAEMVRSGLVSSAAIPIRLDGCARGILSVSSDEPGFFKDKEIGLLKEAAMDISFALTNLNLVREHRRAEAVAAHEKLFSETMIESMPGVLYFYDQTGRILRWNRNFEDVTGYGGDEIAEMGPLEFFADEDRQLLGRKIAEVFEHGESFVEAPLLSKDGRTTPYYFTGRRIVFSGEPYLVGVGIDISERKRAESALREANERLEHKVAERTADLRASKERAESADRMKSAFLATMSHELRTPLNSIIGFTGIVLQELAGPLNAEQSKQLGMVRGSARHLLSLINDILDISKIEAGELEIRAETFDIREAVGRVVDSVKPMAEKKGLELHVDLSDAAGAMVSDHRRIEQILLNLIHNAIKFTGHGRVELSASLIGDFAPDGIAVPAVRFVVSDTGIGIKPDDLRTLFQPFRQIDSGITRQHEGTGLGLAICDRLAKLLGGEIAATSNWSKGSEFTATLPLHLSRKL